MSENEKLILNDLNGPSWSPEKRIKQIKDISYKKENIQQPSEVDLSSVKEASKDSVRAIMLIRDNRIRVHLIANLDPLNIQKKKNIRT